MPLYEVAPADRPEVARKLLAAADDPIRDVRTSHNGFRVSEDLWNSVYPPIDDAGAHAAPEPDAESESESKPAAKGKRA